MKEDGSVPLSDWLSALRDIQAKTAIRRRIDRLGLAILVVPGHCAAV